MLARPLTTILPAMTLAEAIETTCISTASPAAPGDCTAFVTTRPFRAPHQPSRMWVRIGGDRCRCRRDMQATRCTT